MEKDNLLSPIGTPPRRKFDGRPPSTSFLTPRKETSFLSSTRLSPLNSSPRYSLSEETPPRVQKVSRRESITYRSGPLLASTRFNVSLGTYTDVKSPGLVNRIVQYTNEQKETIHTHQPKYGSPGLFPVVHFFKKDVPVITPKQRRVTVKLASPDVGLYYRASDTNIAIEETANNSNHDPTQPDISTRSVLDALKEISRKRINGGEEYSTSPDVKKTKRVEYNLNEFSKRNREESPPKDVSIPITKQTSKRMCVIDPVYASNTSSLFYIERGLKRKIDAPDDNKVVEENKSKQIKLTNAETQTVEIEPKILEVVVVKEREPDKVCVLPKLAPVKTVDAPGVSVFSEKLHEIQMKNKLATVLSKLTGEKPILIPLKIGDIDLTDQSYVDAKAKPAEDTELSKDPEPGDNLNLADDFKPGDDTKPAPASILSPQNKTKHDKHVHFNFGSNNKVETAMPPTSSNASETKVNFSTSIKENFLTTTNIASIPNVEKTISTAAPIVSSAPTFDFGNLTIPAPLQPNPTSPDTGGFKFDLSPPKSNAPTTLTSSPTVPMFNFGNTVTTLNPTTTSLPSFSFGGPTKPENTSTLTFGGMPKLSVAPSIPQTTFTIPNQSGQEISTQLGTLVTSTSTNSSNIFVSGTPHTIGFEAHNDLNNGTAAAKASETNIFNSGINNTTMFQSPTSTASNNSSFGNKNNTMSTTSIFGNVSNINASSMFGNMPTPATPAFGNNGGFSGGAKSFGVVTTTQSLPDFGTTTSSITTSSAFGAAGFGMTSSIFGAKTTTTTSFGAPVSSASIFGSAGTKTTTAATSSIFGNAAGLSSTTTTSAFGASANITNNKTPTAVTSAFGANKTAATFGGFGSPITTVNPPSFAAANDSAPTFGTATTTSGFGAVSSSSGFGAAKAAPAFGAAFGQASNAVGFGAPVTTNSAFGAPATTNAGFGTPATTNTGFSTPATTNSGFGTPATTNSVFGTATTTNSGFGSEPSTGGFNFGGPAITNAGFGTPVTTAASFVALTTSAPAFGTAVTMPLFGSTTTPAFGSTSIFGGSATVTTTAFNFGGSTVNTSTTTSPFGLTSSTSTFATTNATPAFGANAPLFAAPTTTQSTFGVGSQAPAFGTNASSTFGAKTTASIFGTTNTPAFGTAGSAPPFGPTNSTPAFGSTSNNNNNTFGTTAPAFGTNSFGNAAATGFSTDFTKNQSNAAFGSATNTATSPFASTGPSNFNSFGGSANANNQQGSVFAFGSSATTPAAVVTPPNPAKSGGVFSFGGPEAPKPAATFNFTGAGTPNFGSATPNFGSPNFGNASTQGFNSQFNAPNNMFSIGSGSSVKPRTQLKAKRRT